MKKPEKKKPETGSNKDLDKLKDFIYDSIDYIIMAAVIIIVLLIIRWRVGNMFENKNMVSKRDIETIKEHQKELANKPKVKKEVVEEEEEEVELIKVNIPRGAVSYDIGQILEDTGVIENRKEFVNYVHEKNMETKLKYGNFEIPKNGDFDEIIDILSK